MIESLQNEEDENRLYATYTRPVATSRTTTATNANTNTNTNTTIGNNFPHLPPPTNFELAGSRTSTTDGNKNNNGNSQTSKPSSPALTTASLNFGAPPTIWKTATQSSQRFNDNLSSAISNYSGIVDEGIEVSYVVKNPKDSNIDHFLQNVDSHYGDQQSQLEGTSNSNMLDGNSANATSKLGTPTTGSSFISTNVPQTSEDLQISKISNAVKVGHHPTRMSSLNRASNLHLEDRAPSMNNDNNNNSSNYSNITSPQTSNLISSNRDIVASQPPQRTNVTASVNVSDTRTAYSSPGFVLLNSDDSEVNHLKTSSIGSGHMASESGSGSGSSSASRFNLYSQGPIASSVAGSDSGSQVPLLLSNGSNGTQNWGHDNITENHKGDLAHHGWSQQGEYGVTENLVESADGISVVSSVVQPLHTLTDSSKNDISPMRTELKDVSPIIPRRSSARLRNKANANRVSAPAVPMLPLGVISDTQPVYQPIVASTATTTTTTTPATVAEGSAPQMKVEQNGLHIHQPVRIRSVESGSTPSERRRKAKSTPSSEAYYDQVLGSEQGTSNIGLNTNYGTSAQNVVMGNSAVTVEQKREKDDKEEGGGESGEDDDNRYLVRPLPEVPYDTVYQAKTTSTDRVTEKQASGDRAVSSKERVDSGSVSTTSKSSTPKKKTTTNTTRSKGSPRKPKKHVHSIDIDTLNQLLNVTKGTLIGSEFTNLGMQFEERKLLEKLVDSLSRLTADMILDPDRYEEGLRRLEKATKALDGF